MTDTNERQRPNPATATDAGLAETFSQAAADAQGKMRILVADGNATIRKLLRSLRIPSTSGDDVRMRMIGQGW